MQSDHKFKNYSREKTVGTSGTGKLTCTGVQSSCHSAIVFFWRNVNTPKTGPSWSFRNFTSRTTHSFFPGAIISSNSSSGGGWEGWGYRFQNMCALSLSTARAVPWGVAAAAGGICRRAASVGIERLALVRFSVAAKDPAARRKMVSSLTVFGFRLSPFLIISCLMLNGP